MAWLVPRAHGTPTMKGMEADDLLCSRNARPGRDRQVAARCPSCSQNAHGEEDGMTPTLVLCSRNARPQKGLVRRPHVDQHGCPSGREKTSELGMAIKRGNVLAWDKSASWRARGWWARMLRAVKGSLGHSLELRCSELEGPRSG